MDSAACFECEVTLQQLPAIRNIAGLGAKALNQQRVKVLLHELNVCDGPEFFPVGQAEHQEQTEKHGSKRQMMQLAKDLMRVFAMMGLGSTGAEGHVSFSEMDEQDLSSGSQGQCSAETSMNDSGFANYVFMFLLVTTWFVCFRTCCMVVFQKVAA